MCRLKTAVLTFILLGHTVYSQSPLSLTRKPRMLNFGNTAYFGEVNITNFPECAYTNCITSDQFSPSRLGCVEPELTTDCLCNKAATPLSCAPGGPSDQNNCWASLEDWFAGVCNGSVAFIESWTMPECIQNCVFNFLKNQGCAAQTRNCFCILPRNPILQAATACYSANCTKKKASSFSPAEWHDNICNLGETTAYDQSGYDSYVTMVYRVRLSTAISVAFISTVLMVIGIVALTKHKHFREGFGLACVGIAISLVLLIIVPVYTTL